MVKAMLVFQKQVNLYDVIFSNLRFIVFNNYLTTLIIPTGACYYSELHNAITYVLGVHVLLMKVQHGVRTLHNTIDFAW